MEDVTQYRSFNHIHTAADMSDTRFAQVDLLWTARDSNGDQPQSLVYNRAKAYSNYKDNTYHEDRTMHFV